MRISDWSSDVCSSDLRDEGATGEARLVHQTIEQERGTRLIAGFLEYKDEQKQDQNLRQEYQHAAETREDAVDQQALERAVRQALRGQRAERHDAGADRSEEHTSELQSLMRISYADFCLQ